MRAGFLTVVVVAALLGGAAPASAQVLSVEFEDGRVRLIAENVPVSRILAEWSRVGGTQFVHGERVPGAPVTLELVDVPEREALDVVLRQAGGYMAAARSDATAGRSRFDRILILPPSSGPRTASFAPPPPVSQRDAFFLSDDGLDPVEPFPGEPEFEAPELEPEPPADGDMRLDGIERPETGFSRPGFDRSGTSGSPRPGTISPVPEPDDEIEP